ncbi:hypothetical protein VNO77_20957 [Canavalia gladiata]|uniref:Uncharacterized protein n=1 Tax=Canavalia gladiata TaxID=3824 RepID=A0AAN9LUA2_CANGL
MHYIYASKAIPNATTSCNIGLLLYLILFLLLLNIVCLFFSIPSHLILDWNFVLENPSSGSCFGVRIVELFSRIRFDFVVDSRGFGYDSGDKDVNNSAIGGSSSRDIGRTDSSSLPTNFPATTTIKPVQVEAWPPVYHPQTPNCPEETLTREYLQSGYRDTVEGLEDSIETEVVILDRGAIMHSVVNPSEPNGHCAMEGSSEPSSNFSWFWLLEEGEPWSNGKACDLGGHRWEEPHALSHPPVTGIDYILNVLFNLSGHKKLEMTVTETPKKAGTSQIVKLDKALKLAQLWVNSMSKTADDERTNADVEGRPPRLGLGAKVSRQSKVGPSDDPVERKLYAKLNAEKRKAANIAKESTTRDVLDDDEDNDNLDSRTNAFAKRKAEVPLISSILGNKKQK